jgi:large-conductance mechanosensitive channel
MLKNAKLILAAIAILIAGLVVWALVGVVITIVKFLLLLAVILFGVSIFRKLSGKSKPRELDENDSDGELAEAMRQLEEIKRKQLIK